MKFKSKFIKLALLIAFGAFFVGCSSRYNMSVYLSPDLVKHYGYYPSLEVDIVGLNKNEAVWMQSYKLDKYFEPGNPMRKSLLPYTMHFSQQKAVLQVDFSDKEKSWKQWIDKGATELMIAVNLPGISDDSVRKVVRDIHSIYGMRDYLYVEIRPVGITFLDAKPPYAQKKQSTKKEKK